MAEGNDGQEKTEQPTEKRLRESREQGQVPRSKELATAVVFGSGVLVLMGLGGDIGKRVAAWLADALSRVGTRVGDPRLLPTHFFDLLGSLLLIATPIAIAALVASLLAPALLGGFNWSNKALVPDFSKMDPMKGLKRIYGREGFAEFVRSLLRVAVIGGFGTYAIVGIAPGLLTLMHKPLETSVVEGFSMALKILIAMAIGLFLIALFDAPYQLWSNRQKLLMSRQELRDEMKESEGSPEVKGKIRRLQQEMAQRRMMEDVPQADAILVNPTHYAVALRYEAPKMRAPVVVAKGVDLVAQTIRTVGERHRVPIISSPALARSLYRQVQIGREIPVDLYAAVAQVLTYVHQLRHWRRYGGRYPDKPSIEVPDQPER
ncbi:flagellar biosynthesis protein FlhB [Pseudomarimonas salicorniae]|uniref:Flagellar biosynthetic protein FlhB n=1 Tax=Pseudomarimonas salicorniae TaxID=2933270 RepID=A0ABT0GL24_9GAMM|nr:flagellar biosynthesis protein FlhB [Lysobacter sp. CAU 1642]MCK7595138.1 flagellar biosynthesis protein FlhB [Lysobacter sp. CAU 1642]